MRKDQKKYSIGITLSFVVFVSAGESSISMTKLGTWLEGNHVQNAGPSYSNNLHPGGRSNFAFWVNNKGNFQIFGGLGPQTPSNQQCPRADLWQRFGLNNWSFMGGEQGCSVIISSWPDGFASGAFAYDSKNDSVFLFGGQTFNGNTTD